MAAAKPKPKAKRKAKAKAPKAKAAPKSKGGRPCNLTKSVADKICGRISQGESLRRICEDPKLPNRATVNRWLADDRYIWFRDQYAHAKDECADYYAEEILDIADDSRNDYMDKQYGDETVRVPDQENIQRSKLRVDARKWIASKLKPKKYGDSSRVDLNVDVTDALAERMAKARARLL